MKKRRKKSTAAEPELGPAYRVRRDGALCAVFVNTASAKRRARDAGPLTTWEGLLAWAEESCVLGSAEAELLEHAGENPGYAAAALHRVASLRLLIERILLALASDREPDPSDLGALNAELARGSHLLVRTAGGYRWVWSPRDGDDLDRLLLPVVASTAEVLASADRRRVRRCGGKDCDLLFVDRTPGSHRRWCSQESCGRPARARRRYRTTLKPRRDERRRRWRSPNTGPSEPSP